jgi:hypothetical protein
MMFVFFNRPDGKSLAINTDHIISVIDGDDGVILNLTTGSQTVTELYLETVARLNQKGGCGGCC